MPKSLEVTTSIWLKMLWVPMDFVHRFNPPWWQVEPGDEWNDMKVVKDE